MTPCFTYKTMLLFLNLTQFMGVITTLLIKIALKTYLTHLFLFLPLANSKQTVYLCLKAEMNFFKNAKKHFKQSKQVTCLVTH